MASADEFLDAPASGLGALAPDQRRKLRYNAPELDAYADEINNRYGLPPGLIRALKNAGERSNSWQVSPVGARGVMQFMPSNLRKYGVVDVEDPYELIDAAGRYLRDTSQQYGGNVEAMIADFNGGPRQAKRVLRGERPAAAETDAYLTRVSGYLGGGSGGGGSRGALSADDFLDAGAPLAERPPAPDFSNVTVSTSMSGGVTPNYAPAFEDPGNPLETSNPLWGLVDRSNKLLGSMIRGTANVAEPIGDKLETALPLSGLTPDQIKNENQLQPLFDLADWFSDDVIKHTPSTSLDDVKSIVDPSSADSFLDRAGTLGSFIGERVVTSIPDMAAAASGYTLPSYILGRTNEVATRRVENDGRTGEPGLGDMAAALPAATGEALLERLATRALPGLGSVPGKTAGARIAAQTGIQSGTEAAEEGIANLGESLGTQRGVVLQELGDAMLEGGLVGGGMGGTVQTVGEGANVVRNAAMSRPTAGPRRSADAFLDEPAAEAAPVEPQSEAAVPVQPAPVEARPVQQDQPAPPAQEEVMQNAAEGQQSIGESRPVAPPVAEPKVTGEMQTATEAPAQIPAPAVADEAPAAQPIAAAADPVQADGRQGAKAFTATVEGKGDVTLVDAEVAPGISEIIAYDGNERVGSLLYAADGTPPTVEVEPVFQRRGIATAMYALARQQGGVLGDAETGLDGVGTKYRTDDGQAFRQNADEGKVSLRPYAPPVGNTNIPTNGQLTAPVEMPVSQAEQSQAAPPTRQGAARKDPPIVAFRKKAAEIEPSLPQVGDGFTRLWRGNRPGEVGQNPQFTDDLPGIALPFQKSYGGPLSYVDVETSDLKKYVRNTASGATDSEFMLPAEIARNAVAYSGDALEYSNDRRNFPDERQSVAGGSQSAAPRAAAELEAAGEGPVEASQRGRGASEDFMRASFTNRRSWSQKAFRDAGLDPDAAELLPIDKQFEAVARVSTEKYGMRVQKSDKALGRMAVDSATDLYRNAETMAHVLGLPAKAIGLGDSLTVLFRDGAPYLGAMYPKGGKVEGVDLPPGAIALPRRSNSFAHEWGHALDLHLVSKYGLSGDNLVSRQIRDQGIDFQPNSSKEAFAKLMNAMFFGDAALAARVSALQQMADNGTPNQQASAKRALQAIARGNSKLKVEGTRYVLGSREFGENVGGKSGARYFGDPAEMLARAFESYVAEKVESAGGDVSVLAKGDRAYLSTNDQRFAQTYPKFDERIKIFAAFDDLFYQLGKEQLIASGVPAANPGNLDAFDPRVWLGDVERPNEYKGIKGALREQADQWNAAREQVRRERARPADPMTRWQSLQNSVMPLVSPIQSAFRVMERRYAKASAVRELANSLVTDPGADRVVGRVLEQAIRVTGGRNYNQFGNIIARYGLDKLDDAGRTQLRRLLVSAEDATQAKPEIVKAASELRRFMDAMWYDNQEAGINIGYTKNGYLPRVVDMANVVADPEGFIEAATKAYRAKLSQDKSIKPGELDQRAEAAARAWHFNLVNAPSMNFNSNTPAENYTKHRSLGPEADVLLEKFYVSDPLEVIHRYIGMSAKNTEFAKLFGEKGEKLNQLFERMGSEGVSKEDQIYMQGMVENLLGRAPSMLDKKPRMAAMLNQVNAYGVMSMLGRVLISSIAEPGMAGIRTGNAANVYRPYWNLFKQSIGTADMKQWREITKAIGLIGDAQADMVIQARLGGTFESTPKTDARLARYFSITGLHALTNAQRVSLMPIAHRYLGSLSDQLAGKPAQAKEARALLAELGVKDPDAFSRWMDDGRPPSIDELFDANGRETEQGAVYMTAMSRINEQIVQAPYRFDRPEMANTPVGRFLYGIMSFNLAFWNNVYKRQAKVVARAAKERGPLGVAGYVGGHLAPPVLAYFFTQLLVTAAREALLNPQRWEEWDRDEATNENLVMLTLSRSFPAGLFDIPIQAYQGLKYQRDLTGIAVGAVPSYFLGNMQKIVQVFQESNSEATNNAEFAGMQGAYQVVANPLIAHLLTSAPGGRIMDPIYGLGLAYSTSAAARDQVATAVVGERDSLRKKRERDARRAAEVESGSRGAARGNVRNDDRRENAR